MHAQFRGSDQCSILDSQFPPEKTARTSVLKLSIDPIFFPSRQRVRRDREQTRRCQKFTALPCAGWRTIRKN